MFLSAETVFLSTLAVTSTSSPLSLHTTNEEVEHDPLYSAIYDAGTLKHFLSNQLSIPLLTNLVYCNLYFSSLN